MVRSRGISKTRARRIASADGQLITPPARDVPSRLSDESRYEPWQPRDRYGASSVQSISELPVVVQVYAGWHRVDAAQAQVGVPPQPLGNGAHAHDGSCVQQAPVNEVPLGQPASPGIMHAPPENCVRTQTSVAAQVAAPHAGPAASLRVPDPPLLQAPTAAPTRIAAASATVSQGGRRVIPPFLHHRDPRPRRRSIGRSAPPLPAHPDPPPSPAGEQERQRARHRQD
jgi:hypothetical protein